MLVGIRVVDEELVYLENVLHETLLLLPREYLLQFLHDTDFWLLGRVLSTIGSEAAVWITTWSSRTYIRPWKV